MSGANLAHVAAELEAQGIDVSVLRQAKEELDVIEQPPGLFARLTGKVKQVAKTQWGHVVGEIKESKEMLALLRRGMSDDDPLSDEERAQVKAQMGDLMRTVPAGLIAATNYCLPLPGTSLVTPLLLSKLGLMPSRWREAHVLHSLRAEHERLLAAGHIEQAEKIAQLTEEIEQEADARDDAAREAALLTHWDANNNGVWDDDEKHAYRKALRKVQALALEYGAEKRWFLQTEDQIFGPVELTRLLKVDPDDSFLVCYEGKSGWVELAPVLGDLSDA